MKTKSMTEDTDTSVDTDGDNNQFEDKTGGVNEQGGDESRGEAIEDESIQDVLETAMPELPEDRVSDTPEEEGDFNMTMDEHREISEAFETMLRTLYDRGYTANELSTVIDGFAHRTNAGRFNPYEYDRIALSLQLRQAITDWRDEQEKDIPERVIAETVEELGRFYRTSARKKLDKKPRSEDADDVSGSGSE